MITSLSWLKNHLATKANLNEVAERLTEIGLEVESIKSSDSNLDNFVICKTLSCCRIRNRIISLGLRIKFLYWLREFLISKWCSSWRIRSIHQSHIIDTILISRNILLRFFSPVRIISLTKLLLLKVWKRSSSRTGIIIKGSWIS